MMYKKIVVAVLVAAAGALIAAEAAHAAGEVVGVSWSNFQEERWKTDEAAIKGALEKAGLKYVSADASGSAEKQAADIESLITKGAKLLIILAWDQDAILPSVEKAKQRGIPVIAYDRLIQDKDVFYITFNNVEVGRMQAAAVFKVKPKGNYVFIKGAATDPNADFLRAGQQEVLDAAIKRATSRTSASSTPTAGRRRTRRRTWSRS
jgi:D-xylose transport system substrate-binding protein